MRPRPTSHTLLLPAAMLFLLLGAAWPRAADARCKTTPVSVKTTTAHGCTVTNKRTSVVNRSTGQRIDVSGTSLTCGALTLDRFAPRLADAQALCLGSLSSPAPTYYGPWDMRDGARVLGRVGPFVSIELAESGYTGGAHPFAYVKRRTFDTRTGEVASLADLAPRRAEELTDAARARFEDHDAHELYTFDARSFSASVVRGELVISFAFSHAVEVVRGSTLDVGLRVTAPEAADPSGVGGDVGPGI